MKRLTSTEWRLNAAVGIWLVLGARHANLDAAELVEVFTEPYRVIALAAAEAGILSTVEVKLGQQVKAGDLVASLDNQVLLASLAAAQQRVQATAARRSAEADLDMQRRRYEKLESLHQQGHASEEELEAARSRFVMAEASLEKVAEDLALARLEVRQIEAQLRRRQVVSPLAGQVVELQKDVGEYVSGAAPEVATVVQLDKLRVKFYVSTEFAATLEVGRTVQLLLPDSGRTAAGVVEFVSPATDADSRTVRVEVMIENQQGSYRSGVPVTLAAP